MRSYSDGGTNWDIIIIILRPSVSIYVKYLAMVQCVKVDILTDGGDR